MERDEEIATIETDKARHTTAGFLARDADSGSQIDVSVHAPEAGTIKELLANEEDTVIVGQDLARLEAGESEGGSKQADQQPKEPAPSDQKKSSDPQEEGEPSKGEQRQPPQEQKAPAPPPKEEKAPSPPKSKEGKKPDQPKPAESPFGAGSRGENRVCFSQSTLLRMLC